MDDDYIEIVWTTDHGKKIRYITRDKVENSLMKKLMKPLMVAGVVFPLVYYGMGLSQENSPFNTKNEKIANYSEVLPYNLPRLIEEKVNVNIECIIKYHSSAVENALSNVSKFEDIIEYASQETGLSKYLLMSVPAVEAGGEIDILRAKSSKGAVGPAQFMENTAKERGMIINKYEDERMSPSIALPEMAGYLEDLINQFDGKIHLGLAAYNWGPGNVKTLIDYCDFSKKCYNDGDTFFERLPSETKSFIIKVLSREALMRQDMINYNQKPLFSEMLADAEDYIVKEGDTIYKIAKDYDGSDILQLNPQIKNPDKLKPGQKIKVKR